MSYQQEIGGGGGQLCLLARPVYINTHDSPMSGPGALEEMWTSHPYKTQQLQ